MKHKFLRNIFFCSIAFVFFAQFSGQNSSTSASEKPAINVSGTLTDSSDQTYSVENITISGRYEDIPVYQKPKSPEVNPDINTTKIDLREISEIRLVSPTILKFNNRDYIEIEVISNDSKKTKNAYIVDRTKRLQCDEVNEAGPIEKELSFLAVKNLEIKRARAREEVICEGKRYLESDKHIVTDVTITKTKSLINQLEDTTKQISKEDPKEAAIQTQLMHVIDELKNTLKSWFA